MGAVKTIAVLCLKGITPVLALVLSHFEPIKFTFETKSEGYVVVNLPAST